MKDARDEEEELGDCHCGIFVVVLIGRSHDSGVVLASRDVRYEAMEPYGRPLG